MSVTVEGTAHVDTTIRMLIEVINLRHLSFIHSALSFRIWCQIVEGVDLLYLFNQCSVSGLTSNLLSLYLTSKAERNSTLQHQAILAEISLLTSIKSIINTF